MDPPNPVEPAPILPGGPSAAQSMPPKNEPASQGAASAGQNPSDHFSNPPFALYQSATLDVNPVAENLQGHTILWLAFKEPVRAGATFRIHSRFSHIQEVTVNGCIASYRRRDGLRNLAQGKKVFSAVEMDINYRAALEIAREGELEIVVPSLEQSAYRPPVPIPRSAPPDVLGRFDNLLEIYRNLIQFRESHNPTIYDLPEEATGGEKEKDKERRTNFLQVKIKYSMSCAVSHSMSQQSALVFRKQPAFVKYFDQQAMSVKPMRAEKTVCMYTASFTANSLKNVDGVRCWLPTLDSLDQRFIFDLSFSLPKSYQMACAGRRLATTRSQRQQQNAQGKSRRHFFRFFTPFRIPAAQLGFFIGKVEAYKMPLYKNRAKIWVAMGIGDYLGQPVDPTAGDDTAEADGGAHSSSHHAAPVTGSGGSALPGAAGADSTADFLSPAGVKRSRAEMEGGEAAGAGGVRKHPRNEKPSSEAVEREHGGTEKVKVLKARNLYEEVVYHTFLGLDLGLRLLHKFAGHKHDYSEVLFIFVYDLGRDFMPFDGFVLVDMRFLHGGDKLYMETPAHLALLSGYLYSWLRSSLTIASFDYEFLIHGTVGYLMQFYCEEVFGDEDGQYYLQKMLDCVLTFEKQGRALPLCAFYPERYETFSLSYGQYLVGKSVVLFHLIEQAVGGKDPMRVALKHMIKSPLLFTQSAFRSMPQNPSQSPAQSSSTSSPLHVLVDTPMHDASPPYSQGSDSVHGSGHGSPYYASLSGTPLHGQASPLSPVGGYQSPHPYFQSGSMSPFLPFHGAGRYPGDPIAGSAYYYAGGSPSARERGDSWGEGSGYRARSDSHGSGPTGGRPALTRQVTESSWEKDGLFLSSDLLTPETFLVLIRHASEAATEIDEDLLERYVYDCGALFLRVHVSVSDRIENKPRSITVTTEQVGYKQGGLLGKQYAKRGELSMLMVEDRDGNLTEPVLLYSDHIEKHVQQAYSRPGRRGGKRRKGPDLSKLDEQQLKDRERAEREKELRKSALQLVRGLEYPVRYAIVDPTFRHILEVQNISYDALNVEQLNVNYESLGGSLEKHRVHLQIQALRSLARSVTSAVSTAIPQWTSPEEVSATTGIVSVGELPARSARVQLKACVDCILGVSGAMGLESVSASAEANTCVYVRGEAAFALAQWQNENAPFSVAADYDPVTDWPGMEMLLDCILALYVDTQARQPLALDSSNEGSVYLRHCLLLALSSIKSQQGYSPREVIELFMVFLEHVDDPLEATGTGSEGDTREETASSRLVADETHSTALLFQAMSRLRHAPIDTSNKASQVVFRIIPLLSAYVRDAFTEARSLARMRHVAGDANLLPRLPGDGLAVAAALTCLSEIDIQAIQDFVSARGNGGSKLRQMDHDQAPPSRGLVTDMRYHDFFLRPGADLKCVLEEERKRGLREHFVYHLCTPVVRLAAFEAFVRICFALHHAKVERLEIRAKAAGTGTGTGAGAGESIDACWFIPSAVEALQYLLEHDPSVSVRQQAAQVFFDAVLERPARVVWEALSLGHAWGCLGWHDPLALTLPHRPRVKAEDGLDAAKQFVSVRKSREALVKTQGRAIKIALDYLLKVVQRTGAFHQTLRTALLQTWIYAFKRNVPRVYWVGGQPPAMTSPLAEDELPAAWAGDRFAIQNPTEAFNDFEQSLKFGPLYRLPVTPRVASLQPPSQPPSHSQQAAPPGRDGSSGQAATGPRPGPSLSLIRPSTLAPASAAAASTALAAGGSGGVASAATSAGLKVSFSMASLAAAGAAQAAPQEKKLKLVLSQPRDS